MRKFRRISLPAHEGMASMTFGTRHSSHWEDPMYQRIYVPVDNSDHSNRAIACSVELGRAFDYPNILRKYTIQMYKINTDMHKD